MIIGICEGVRHITIYIEYYYKINKYIQYIVMGKKNHN